MSPIHTAAAAAGPCSYGGSVSPRQTATPKNVAFELMFSNSPQYRARLPMRVQIYPHDTTDSIVTTVKNFYGLYSGPTGSKGVSFEDDHGNTLIARYENFANNMVVYVRVIEEAPTAFAPQPFHPATVGSESYYPAEGYQAQQPQRFDQDIHRPASRASRRRSPSPNANRGRRSDSTSTSSKKARSRSVKNRRSMAHGHADTCNDSLNGYSSGDGALSTTSGKTKEQIGNTDISVENIVEGGRRKRAKFESSVGNLPFISQPNKPKIGPSSTPCIDTCRRSCLCLRRRRCQQQPQTLPSPRLAESSTTGSRCLLCIRVRILLQTRARCSLRRTTTMALFTPACMPPLPLSAIARAAALDMPAMEAVWPLD